MDNTSKYVYLKYEDEELKYSSTESGPFEKVEDDTTVSKVWKGDTVTFQAIPDGGIKKLLKIKGARNGSAKLMRKKKRKSRTSIIATISDNCCPGEVDKFDIKFRTERGEKIIIDPEIEVRGNS